jgi:hypothetical protein
VSELLALLGRFGPRLVYPGGLGLLLLALLLLQARRAGRTAQPTPLGLLACAAPLLGLALVPLPGATSLERNVDLLTVLLLLDLPLWLHIVREGPSKQRVAALAGILNAYPVLVLAALAMTATAGSLNLAALGGAGGLTSVGAACWALVVGGAVAPPALGGAVLAAAALWLRCIGHWALAGSLLLSLGSAAWPFALRVALGLALAVLLLGAGRWLGRRVVWPRLLAWVSLLLIGWLLWLAASALVARLG